MSEKKNWRTVLSNFVQEATQDSAKTSTPTQATTETATPVTEKSESSAMTSGATEAALEFLSSINFGSSDSEEENDDLPEEERYEGDTDENGQVCYHIFVPTPTTHDIFIVAQHFQQLF